MQQETIEAFQDILSTEYSVYLTFEEAQTLAKSTVDYFNILQDIFIQTQVEAKETIQF